ncbi:MAG TPA: hypothetical protein PKO36_13965 [Candidatus Hydrogenedentes bacterium]|nr:hypothetical protein [Candidatus Hydrogenedentota bacterium]HOV73836.1 hypothetical protein [Candidatus Hydrogenedentota bacterium]
MDVFGGGTFHGGIRQAVMQPSGQRLQVSLCAGDSQLRSIVKGLMFTRHIQATLYAAAVKHNTAAKIVSDPPDPAHRYSTVPVAGL